MFKDCFWVYVVIVYYISGFYHFNIFKTLDSVEELKLRISRYASGYPIRVNDVSVEAFRFEPDVVAVSLWEPFKLFFN